MVTVSARIPEETHRHAVARLKQIGSSQSELIRAAYDYVAACGHLPVVMNDNSPRVLDEQRRCALVNLCKRSSTGVVVQHASVGDTWRVHDLVVASRRRRYEAID